MIQNHLYVVEKIKNGISRVENGETSSHDKAKQTKLKKFRYHYKTQKNTKTSNIFLYSTVYTQ